MSSNKKENVKSKDRENVKKSSSKAKSAKKKKQSQAAKNTLSKAIPVFVAIILIIVVIAAFYGQKIVEKYSYGTERYDMNQYFNVESGKLSVVLDYQRIEDKAVLIDARPYISQEFVEKYFTDHFYVNLDESSVLYTTADQTIKCMIGDDFPYYLTKDKQIDLEYAPVIKKGDTLYFALDYVAMFVYMNYHIYSEPEYIKIDLEGLGCNCAVMTKDSAVRYQGGIKSPILDDVIKGERIGVIEEMEDWAKVVTSRGITGYIQIKQFEYAEEMFANIIQERPMIPLEYTDIKHDGKINMAFEQVFADPASNFGKDTENVRSVNVIAPTLYRIKDNDGTVEALPATNYVKKAHEKGMDVWVVWTDVDYEVDMKQVLGTSTKRNALISRMISEAKECGCEGINIDFERIGQESARDFVQFLRELSVETHKEGIILSVDNYALASVTKFYDRKEQGNVCDYVIIMGYDEHWASSQEAGSVASINYVERGIKETLKEVSADKVINAVPFYTRIWRTTDDGKVSSETIGMELQNNWIEQTGITLAWDNESCQKYGEKMIGGKTCQIWVEDAESLQVKLSVMDSYKLAGVAEWKLGFETPDIWDVFEQYMAGAFEKEEGAEDGGDKDAGEAQDGEQEAQE